MTKEARRGMQIAEQKQEKGRRGWERAVRNAAKEAGWCERNEANELAKVQFWQRKVDDDS
jgi:hypothetical protein